VATVDGIGSDPPVDRWVVCITCKHQFTGAMELGLARPQWARACDGPEANEARLGAVTDLANALCARGQHTAAAAMHRENLEMQKWMFGHEYSDTLITASNPLANTLC
jgi:hypothetical protein